MASLEELRETRIKKLEALQKAGLNVFPGKVNRDYEIAELLRRFFWLSIFNKQVSITGRIRTLRSHGSITFINLEDASGRVQLMVSRDELGKDSYSNFLENYDVGDFIAVTGILFRTKTGEKTLRAHSIEMAAKALRPLPEKWHGLQDVEERYRRRYLDLLMSEKEKERFFKRSAIVRNIREFLDRKGFMEVETPALQTLAGGATAKPFRTHLNALNMDLYLRIAPELYLKRLLVGGLEKIYEIGRNFRNEGMDASHNPEFTMMEVYIAYKDSNYLKTFIKNLLQMIVKTINHGNLLIKYEDQEINFSGDWEEIDYLQLIKKFENKSKPEEGITAWDVAKKTLIQPTIVSGFPKDILPLAKSNGNKADAFQIIIGGWELVKAFTEQNNPLEQRKRFEEQEKLRQKGDIEAQQMDEDFLEALEYGMPPSAGFSFGIDRLAALLTDSHSLREIILFPTMKPKGK